MKAALRLVAISWSITLFYLLEDLQYIVPACFIDFINKNNNNWGMDLIDIKSEWKTMIGRSFIPELAEVLIAFFLFDAVDDTGRIIGDLHDVCEFNKVDWDNEDSIERIGGLIIWSKDPVVIPFQAILAPNDEIIGAINVISIANDDVVVLYEAVAHFLK
jgi:hypothetical protein